jgi:hypothetical protein
MIYFIQAESGPIKIGHTNGENIRDRLDALQVGNHEELICIGIRKGTLRLERTLHERFRYIHKRGEWFYPVRELLAYIEKKCNRQRLSLLTHNEIKKISQGVKR